MARFVGTGAIKRTEEKELLTGKTDFLPEAILMLHDNLEFCIRILLAGGLGGIIGLERTRRQKAAGIRTHCIIAVASATFMVLSKYAFMDTFAIYNFLDGKGADPSRIASQVVTGISFLGAGVIFKNEKATIKGLTTAAGVWDTSAIGMAIGAGLYWVSVFTTAVLALIQWLFHRFPSAPTPIRSRTSCSARRTAMRCSRNSTRSSSGTARRSSAGIWKNAERRSPGTSPSASPSRSPTMRRTIL